MRGVYIYGARKVQSTFTINPDGNTSDRRLPAQMPPAAQWLLQVNGPMDSPRSDKTLPF